MANSKSKLLINKGKTPSVKLGASTSSKKDASPLGAKKDYKKKGADSSDFSRFGMTGFGDTGLTGES